MSVSWAAWAPWTQHPVRLVLGVLPIGGGISGTGPAAQAKYRAQASTHSSSSCYNLGAATFLLYPQASCSSQGDNIRSAHDGWRDLQPGAWQVSDEPNP